jgi:hypothetical protein
MACYRGTMVWLDGQTSDKSWSCGTEGNTLTSSNLQIGPHRVEEIEVFGPAGDDCDPERGCFYVFEDALVPKEIELTTPNGKYRGPVTKVVIADMDSEEPTIVRLANGEDYEIDEITLYLRAILQPV